MTDQLQLESTQESVERMKAVYLNELGPPEKLTLGELPDPAAPGPGEIIVDIVAASINGADTKVRRGATKGLLAAATKKFPYVLGRDFSGYVQSVGEGVTDFKIGDAVLECVTWVRKEPIAKKFA